MSDIQLEIEGGRSRFQPLEELRGRVRWQLGGARADSIAVQLLWHTEGKGTQDADVVETVTIEQPPPRGERAFTMQLPAGPYSCSGKLLSVVWKLQTVVEPGDEVSQTDLVIAPGDGEVNLEALAADALGEGEGGRERGTDDPADADA